MPVTTYKFGSSSEQKTYLSGGAAWSNISNAELDDGSYAEVKQHATDAIFSLDAKGNGDSFHHVVNWHLLR
jgi:hypothetical protein